jgi:hypothetical protein
VPATSPDGALTRAQRCWRQVPATSPDGARSHARSGASHFAWRRVRVRRRVPATSPDGARLDTAGDRCQPLRLTVRAHTRAARSGASHFAGVTSGGERALGDLTTAEIREIQAVVDEAGRPLEIVGSAARGTRREIGTGLPIGKEAGMRSDIDYLAHPQYHPHFKGLEGGLPSIDPKTGLIPGVHNPFMGPAIRFEPGVSPFYVPGAP